MTKKGKKAKAAAAKAAAAAFVPEVEPQAETTTNSIEASDVDDLARLTKNRDLFEQAVPRFNHVFDDNSTSYSLPNSPVIKVTRSIQPSPALSATVSQAVDEDFRPIALPPLSIGEVLQPGTITDIDWSLLETNPVRGKRSKPRGDRIRSPVRGEVIVKEPAST